MILVFAYQSPVAQIALMMVFFIFYWVYLILVRPFKEMKYNLYIGLVDLEMLIIHILFLCVATSEPESSKEVEYTYNTELMILIMLFTYIVIAIIEIILFIYQLCCVK